MKKIILFLLFYFLLGYISVSANRYGLHYVSYNSLLGGGITACDQDGQGTPGTCAQISGSPIAGNGGICPTGPLGVSSSGNMPCLYWDGEIPTISDNYGFDGVWTKGPITITLNPLDTGGSGIHGTSWCEGATCNPAIGTSGTTITITNSGNYNKTIRYQTWDISGNASVIGSVIVKLDNNPPTISDVTNNNSLNLLANDNYSYGLTISENGGSPIVQVIGAKENRDDESFTSFNDTISPWNQSWDISKVDNFRNIDSNTARQYTFKLTKIKDEAGNEWNGTQNYNHNVYANSLNLSGSISQNDLDDNTNIADGSQKNLTIKLEDTYGNDIIPTPLSGIGRTVDFTFDTEHSLYLNQYERTGNGVYLNIPNDSNFINRILTGHQWTTFVSQLSSNGEYPFKFKIYTPTKESYDKSDSSLNFNNIQASINGDIGANLGYSISGGDFDLRSRPIYYTTLSGEMKDDGFIEGAQQSNNIQISKSGSTSTLNNFLYIEFGSGDTNQTNTSLNLKVGSNSGSVNDHVGEGNPNKTILYNNFSTGYYTIYTKLLLQTGGILNDIQSSYFSTHIGYNIVAPSGTGTINPVYNSDVYNKTSYWGTIGTGGTYASAVKIIGQTYSKKYSEILSGQSGIDVKLLNGSITKSSLKTNVRRNAYNIIKNTPLSNTGNTIYDSNFIDNSDGVKLLSGSMIYFGSLNGQNITLNPLTFVGNKTILIEGGNLYIKGNINVSGSKSMLSIVVLKDSNGKGGNIYINPSVSYIKATMYADKSLISYDGTNELDGNNSSFSTLKNQLYIYGSVFSENTIGGSRANPIKCPYYVDKTTCNTLEIAQKYDLNYLRRYYLKDTNSDGIGDTPAGGGFPYFTNISTNYKYPVVIQYNPLIQTNPSILFRK